MIVIAEVLSRGEPKVPQNKESNLLFSKPVGDNSMKMENITFYKDTMRNVLIPFIFLFSTQTPSLLRHQHQMYKITLSNSNNTDLFKLFTFFNRIPFPRTELTFKNSFLWRVLPKKSLTNSEKNSLKTSFAEFTSQRLRIKYTIDQFKKNLDSYLSQACITSVAISDITFQA